MEGQSLAGMIKGIVQSMMSPSVISCTVASENPPVLRFDGDDAAELDGDCLVVPAHVGRLRKGRTAYVSPVGDGTYFVLGTEAEDGA